MLFPKEVWFRIFLHLEDDLSSVAALSRCNKFIHSVGTSNLLWKRLFERHFFRDPEEDDEESLASSEPTFSVDGGHWIKADCDQEPCAHCERPPDDDMAVFLDNCVMHRACLQACRDSGVEPMCKCGLAADPEIDGRKRFVCTGCRRDGIKLICNVAHSDTDPANCFLCDKCLLHISFTGNLRCCCGASIYLEAVPLIRHKLASKRFLELDSSFDKVNFKDEYKRVFTSGSGPVLNAALSVLKTQWFDTLLGLGILFVWIIFVLFAQNWLTLTKFWCLLGFAVLVGIYMFGEGLNNKLTRLMRDGLIGPGFAKTIWRWSRWSSYVGIAITLVLFAVFFGAILWDAVVDFGLSVLFLLCSLAALAYVMYHNHTRALNWILFLCFFCVPLIQIVWRMFFVGADGDFDDMSLAEEESFLLFESVFSIWEIFGA